ncbi:uncharacterized protein LOC109536439 isoform X1 [Dendroctonus ponderosae]|uniref:uncharacterized protein LOC109536439 isoform X1 n=1 Tax=Dendroctonus ponderosae TaxID=77166 RepID=UPI0020354F5A|nr:uncharacterized protein LOC109536439 isoform X1 [Dendroctonus ponderosae]
MLVRTVLLALLAIGVYSELDLDHESGALNYLLTEGLRVNPVLVEEETLSEESRRFISAKYDSLVRLVGQRQRAVSSRTKRSLDVDPKTNSIIIKTEKVVPIKDADDFRLFQSLNSTLAASLENGNSIVLYRYLNGSFKDIHHSPMEYNTNLVVASTEDGGALIVVGTGDFITIFQFNLEQGKLEKIQHVEAPASKHVALWKQGESVYLSATDRTGRITVFRWLGRHFDRLQEIQLSHVKKTVHFSFHDSDYLAAVNEEVVEGEKTFSEILKFDVHSGKFKPYQRLLTKACTDIKYFTCKLHNTYHHFLIVSQVVNAPGPSKENGISVIYKYDQDYFVPFQSIATNAVEWQPVQDLEENSALIAVTPEGLQGFQFDGWYFFESRLIADNEEVADLNFQNIKALHTFDFFGQELLVLACQYCSQSISLYSVNFTQYSTLEDESSELLSWCTNKLQELSNSLEPPMLAARLRGDLNEEFFEDEDPKRQMAAALSKASLVLDGIEETLKDLIVNADVLEADTLIFNNDTQVNGLQVAAVNALEVDDVLDKVLDIAEGFSVNNSMNFTVVVTENSLSLSTLNGSPLEEYVSLRKDLMLEEFTVQGPVAFQSGLLIGNHTINDVEITEKNLLLKEGDQDFSENLSVDELRVNELTSNNLNCFALDSLSDNGEEIFNIGALKVKHLSIGGLLNNVDIKSLAKRGLRKSGNQFWETPLSFNSLEVEELQIKELSGKLIPQNLVPINAGQYHVHQDVTFTKDLRTNRLDAGQSLNNIAVKCNGLLDVLLIDSPEQQEIPARKSFTNLTLKRRYSPLIIDESPCEILNDLRINGSVKLSKRLKVRDLKPANSSGSMGEVLANGIKLTDVEMPVHLTFTQPLKVESIRVDKINSLDPNKWILGSSASPQVLTGHKQFWGDIHLKGPVNVANMNNIDVGALENHTLRVEGDQEIGGFWTVESLVANKGVLANKTQLPEGSRTSLRIKGDLEARVNTSEFTLQGLVNSNRLQDVLGNMVEKNTKYRVFGEKHFKDLHVQDLEIPEHSNISKLLRTVTSGGEITLKTDLDLFNNISIRRVQFKGRLNDLTRADFDGLMHLDSNPEETVLIPSDVKFKELVVLGEVFVADNSINGQNLTAIEQDTVKIDEDHVFHSGVFEETVTVGDTLRLNGSVENLDLDFIVLQNGSRMVEIADIVFNDTLVVNGTLFLHGTANGVDLRKFCTFSQQREKSLKIFGKVVFAKGPKVFRFNNHNVKNLMKTLWFTDRAANITETLHMKNATFTQPLYVEKFVDDINLNLLSQNYLSKSKSQEIPASLTFSNVTFSNISTTRLNTDAPINGILLEDLLSSMLLQSTDQVFESVANFEEAHFNNLTGSFTVNDLNLETDVMRYDAQNAVTGRKVFQNLNIRALKLPRNVKIQDVDVLDWLDNAVMNNGTFRISGKKVFNNATFKQGLSLRGTLNNQTFNENTIMLLNRPQNIAGKKAFFSDNQQPITLRTVRVKGLVNGINLQQLVQNQTNRLRVLDEDFLQESVIFSQLNSNVSALPTHNWEGLRRKFNQLLNMGRDLQKSLNEDSTIFKYFKQINKFDNVYEIFGLRCADGIFRLVAFTCTNGRNRFRTFQWETQTQAFTLIGENPEFYLSKPIYMEQLTIGNQDYIFVQHPDRYDYQNYKYVYSGSLLELTNATHFKIKAEFHRNSTESLTHFQSPASNQTCLAFIGQSLPGLDIYCYEAAQKSFYWAQRIDLDGIYKALAVEALDSVYLFLARHQHPLSHEPCIEVFQSTKKLSGFQPIQTIYEGVDLNGLAAATINGKPFVAFSFGYQESTVQSGRVTIRRLDLSSNQFKPLQDIPVPVPKGVHFITQASFEPLLLIQTADRKAPLRTLSYDGVAGFREILRGSSLPISSKVRTVGNGHFVVALQENRQTGSILEAVAKGFSST